MKKLLSVSCILVSSIFMGAANADSGAYIGASIGATKASDKIITGDDWNNDHEDMTYKFFTGYQFNEVLSIEGGYTDLGKNSAMNYDAYLGVIDSFDYIDEIDTQFIVLKAGLPISDSSTVYMKLGQHYWDKTHTETRLVEYLREGKEDLIESTETSSSGDDLTGAIGYQYDFSKISVQVELERYIIDSEEVDTLSVGLSYNF